MLNIIGIREINLGTLLYNQCMGNELSIYLVHDCYRWLSLNWLSLSCLRHIGTS